MRRPPYLGLLAVLASSLGLAAACGGGSTGTGGTIHTGNGGAGGAQSSSGAGATGSSSGLTLGSSSGNGGTGGTSSGGTSSGSMSSSGASSGGTSSGGTSSSGMSSSGTSSGGGAGGGAASSSGASSSGTASSSSSSSSSSGGPATFGSTCGGTSTTITGTVYAPNATDPIPNVRVYVPITVPLQPFPTNYCDNCVSPIDPAYTSTVSAADGTFTLNLDGVPYAAAVNLAIQIGRFRKWTSVPLTACQNTALALAPNANPAEVLPGATVAGVADIPNILVSTGNTDHLDLILHDLGITQYTCVEGRAAPYYPYTGACSNLTTSNPTPPPAKLADVLTNSAQIGQYNMAFLSCAPDAYSTYTTATGQQSKGGHPGQGYNQTTMANTTAAWVQGGGRLFVTDTSYDYVSQAFPPDITWAGPTGSPQPVDTANIGCAPGGSGGHATLYPITVDDPTLAAWLKVVGFASSPSVSVNGFYEPWSVMSSLPTTTTEIANGTMPLDPSLDGGTTCNTAMEQMTNVPLTAKFDVPTCGRVLFSSYHTYTGTGTAGTAANQQIMEYMIFAAAVCHQ